MSPAKPSRVNLACAARRDKNTEKTSFRFPYQLKSSVEDFARRNGIESTQAAIRRLIILGLALDEHVLHLNYARYLVEPLDGDKDSQ